MRQGRGRLRSVTVAEAELMRPCGVPGVGVMDLSAEEDSICVERVMEGYL